MTNNKRDFENGVENAEYVEVEEAAPTAGTFDYMKHPKDGWVKILDSNANTETDEVVISFADPVTEEYEGLYQTWYPDTETFIGKTDNEYVQDALHEIKYVRENGGEVSYDLDVINADEFVESITEKKNEYAGVDSVVDNLEKFGFECEETDGPDNTPHVRCDKTLEDGRRKEVEVTEEGVDFKTY